MREDFDRAVVRAMNALAEHPRTVFVGQSVRYDGARIFSTLEGVPMQRRREHPVIEDHQLGYSIGLAMRGLIPVCIYPRIDFLLLAMNQLVNHLDKIPTLWGIHPKVIVRTTVGTKKPLDAGPQHTQNHTGAIRSMLQSVRVEEVTSAHEVEETYLRALHERQSFLIVENYLA